MKIEPSLRCMFLRDEKATEDPNHDGVLGEKRVWLNNRLNEDANANGMLGGGEDVNGDRMLQMNIPSACMPSAFLGK